MPAKGEFWEFSSLSAVCFLPQMSHPSAASGNLSAIVASEPRFFQDSDSDEMLFCDPNPIDEVDLDRIPTDEYKRYRDVRRPY